MHALKWLGLCWLALPLCAAAEDPVFSGPQVGEKLPVFTAKGVFGDRAGQDVDFVSEAAGRPGVIVFFHARTRPSFALTNAVSRFAATRANDGLTMNVVFLASDATETENWIRIVERQLPVGTVYTISPDGQEGPGSYGLNRNVGLTVLVAKEGRVAANFALVQPSVQADGPKILKAIVDLLGGGDVPPITDFDNTAEMMRKPQPRDGADDPRLRELMSGVLLKDATAEQVARAVKEVEAYVESNPAARAQLGRSAKTVVDSGKLATYGAPAAQEQLQKWAVKYGTPVEQPPRGGDNQDQRPVPKKRTTEPPGVDR